MAASQLGKTVMGGLQYFQGRKMAKEAERDRPTYEIPGEYQQSYGLARGLAGEANMAAGRITSQANQQLASASARETGLPAWMQQGMRQEQQNAANAFALAKRVARNPAELTSMLANINRNRNVGTRSLGGQYGQYLEGERNIQRQRLDQARTNIQQAQLSGYRLRSDAAGTQMDALGQLAGARDKQFMLNKYAPWQAKTQAAAALMGGGIQNVGGALNDTSALAYSGAFSKDKG